MTLHPPCVVCGERPATRKFSIRARVEAGDTADWVRDFPHTICEWCCKGPLDVSLNIVVADRAAGLVCRLYHDGKYIATNTTHLSDYDQPQLFGAAR